jgi:hypothetical protein
MISTVLACVLAASGIFAVAAPAAAATEDPSDVTSYAPDGTIDVARTAIATASNAEQAWPPSKLTDGDTGTSAVNLWVAADTGVDAGGWVNLALKETSTVRRVVVFPRGDAGFYGIYFPTDYTVTLLDDSGATVAQKEITHDDVFDSVVTKPDIIDFATPVDAIQVRIDVIKRQSREGGVLQFAEVGVFADGTDDGTEPGGDPGTGGDPLFSYQPTGTEDLALAGRVSASSSYEMPGETWSAAFAANGVSGTADGWSTDPYAKVSDPNTDATLDVDLRCAADVSRIVVFPREKDFPKDYSIEVSADGASWNTVGQSLGNASTQKDPQVFDLASDTSARYVRLQVDTRNGPDGRDGYLVQLSEIAVFGTGGACVNQVKPALELEPGASDASWFESIGTPASELTVSSSNRDVATVDSDGTITAVAAGTATVTVTSGGQTLTVPVTVSDDIQRVGDDFEVTVFWPPTVDYVNDEQYKNLADAGIDIVQNAQIETAAPEQNLKMAALADKYGMQILVQDNTVSPGSMSAAEAQAWAERYTNVPGVGGFFLVDEPGDATQYAQAFKAIRDVAPEYYSHLNFLPYWAYGSLDASKAAMQSWLDSTSPRTIDDPDYLMYDLYPFSTSATSYEGLFTGLNATRELGLKNDIKTATYLQSIGIPGNLRRPNADEIRYEANMAMAYGYKQLSYFTWWTPTNRSEPFTDGIMTADGQKTDLYEPVKQLNSEIHALGPTLMNLDAKEVYLTGTNTYGQPTVPSDYFVQSQGSGDLVVSHLVDRASGDDYLFVVNNSFTDEQDVSLTIGDSVTAVREVSRTDGTLGAPVALADAAQPREVFQARAARALDATAASELARHLDPSEGVLYKLVRDDDGDGTDPGGNGSTPGNGSGPGAGGTASTPSGGLANTGSETPWGILIASGLLVAAGFMLTVLRRRSRVRRAR